MSLQCVRGDTVNLVATFAFEGAPASLAGCSLELVVANARQGVRQVYLSSESQIVINTTNSTATCAVTTSTMPNVEASYEFRWILTDGLGNVTTTETSAFVVYPTF